MRQLIIYLLLIGLSFSCKEKTTYQLRILIKNETDTNLNLSLFPNEEYLDGNLYDFSDIGGGYRPATLEITPGLEQELYITSDLKIKPNSLAEKVFKSIQINTSNGSDTELKFSPDTVIGYTENLYKATSGWIYKVRDFNLQTQFDKNLVESHDYIFLISQSNYLEK